MTIPAEYTLSADADQHRPGVALCEPDLLLRELLDEWLRLAGFKPLRCTAAPHPSPVMLVVADVPAPRQSGAAGIATLRRHFPGAKVLAISGQFMPGTHGVPSAAMALGADAVLAKPFSSEMFIDIVRTLVTG
jgi:DNA-binding NarL/FixJ family response regulator